MGSPGSLQTPTAPYTENSEVTSTGGHPRDMSNSKHSAEPRGQVLSPVEHSHVLSANRLKLRTRSWQPSVAERRQTQSRPPASK